MQRKYIYEECKSEIFSEEGQIDFLKVRDNVKELLKIAGAFDIHHVKMVHSDNFFTYACIDRLLELGEIREVPADYQFAERTFVGPPLKD